MVATLEEYRTMLLLVVSACLVAGAMFLYQPAYEAFTLPMLEEALKAHKDHHIIADHSALNDVLGKTGGSLGDERTRFMATSRFTNMDSLTDLELPVSDSLTVTSNRLLDVPRSSAERTLPRIITYMDEDS